MTEKNYKNLTCECLPFQHKKKESDLENLTAQFINEYCNDHNGKVRWLRGIFIDEQEKLDTVLFWLKKADFLLQTQREDIIEELEREFTKLNEWGLNDVLKILNRLNRKE